MTKLLKIVEKVNQGNTGGYLNSVEDPFETGSTLIWASLVAQMVKNPPAMQETWFLSLDLEDPLEEDLATHSSILAWRIPWTEEPAGHSPWGHKESCTAE